MIRRLDAWIGIHVLHPPIIWLCQRLVMTQWAFAAYAWMAATFTLVMRVKLGSLGDLALTVIISLMAVVHTVVTAVLPDMPRRPSLGFRLFVWGITVINLLDVTLRHRLAGDTEMQWALAWDAFALVGEYAKTITTIPPRPKPDPQAGAFERPI